MTALTPAYQAFLAEIQEAFPAQAVITDYARRYAYGTDASFYRQVPEIVLVVANIAQVQLALQAASWHQLPVTFRAAGTSLSGQAVSNSILLLLSQDWNQIQASADGQQVTLAPATIGAKANKALTQFGRKIGPDPASIASCQIGGIVANNASGMCCGVKNNAYHTLHDMVIVFADGTVLDTASEQSRYDFCQQHPDFINTLNHMLVQVKADQALVKQIKHKYRLKNTTGYGINALVDYVDPFEVIKHLLVGSEGTLAFIAEVTLKTVIHAEHRATGLFLFDHIASACQFVSQIQSLELEAVELLDNASINAVAKHPLLKPLVNEPHPNRAALLIEVAGDSPEILVLNQLRVTEQLAQVSHQVINQIDFSCDATVCQQLWQIRKGTFPAVGANRVPGTTVIIEDISLPVERLAEGILALQRLFQQFNYTEAIIFGHALVGNVHFVFTQSFDSEAEIERYHQFMLAVTELVVKDFDGALKAEHGTGRNMAAFVEMEWGTKAYQLMHGIKELFDPKGILNPGVILNNDAKSHLRDLKHLPAVDNQIDPCIECGFCESVCPSHGLTLSPRQRIALQRHISEQKYNNHNSVYTLEQAFQYLGIDSCAATGMCQQQCPVKIDTGQYILQLRQAQQRDNKHHLATFMANHYGAATAVARGTFNVVAAGKNLLGEKVLSKGFSVMNKLTSSSLPHYFGQWPQGAAKSAQTPELTKNSTQATVLYFPSCANRIFAPDASSADQRALTSVVASLMAKAGFNLLMPDNVSQLCCGQPWQSKGLQSLAQSKTTELEQALSIKSQDVDFIVTDTSPCHRRIAEQSPNLKIVDLSQFMLEFVLPRLHITPTKTPLVIHPTCSDHRTGNADAVLTIARVCSELEPELTGIACCGFAGDKGFNLPELNQHSLRHVREAVPQGCQQGYSTSRTCEIGLARHAGIGFQSIYYLLDQVSQTKNSNVSTPVEVNK